MSLWVCFYLGVCSLQRGSLEKHQFVKSSVLVYLGQYNENTIDLVTYGQPKFLRFVEAGKSKTKVLADSVSGEGSLPVHKWLSSCCVLTLWKES